MDIFAHMLWTNVVYRKNYLTDIKSRLWAVFFGVAPDLVSFVPATLYGFFHLEHDWLAALANSQEWVFVWARNSYNYTHSFVIFGIALVIAYTVRKGKIYWPLFGWALHIAIDILTHKDFYETPFLSPLSHFTNHYSVRWSEPTFMVINYGLLAVFYILIFSVWSKKYAKNK